MFMTFCGNKGCGKTQEPLLDKETNEVYCSECGGVIVGITEFAKKSMLGMGQIKKTAKKTEAFMIKCASCSKTAQPLLKSNKLMCGECKEELKGLNSIMHRAVKDFLSSKTKDVDQK